jgi:FlaA1/EpsC-like NDP-sugar epimerase
MAPSEAVALVMKTELRARSAGTYWLDMGAPVRIGDLAARLMTLEQAAGHAPVRTENIGLRPGEKLREELTTQGLSMCRTRSRGIWVARQPGFDVAVVAAAVRRLRRQTVRGDAIGALDTIAAVVSDFRVSPEARAEARADAMHVDAPASGRGARTA